MDDIVKLRLIDLFCGAGGLTEGFVGMSRGLFETVWANDIDESSCATYNRNFGEHCVLGDINELLGTEDIRIPPADVVIGGPPCQGFSLLNKDRENDSRKELWLPFMEVVERSGASVFMMENVPQLVGSPEHRKILEFAERRGFKVWSGVLHAADYGVPQIRKRAFIVASKVGDPGMLFPPVRSHFQSSERLKTLTKNGEAYVTNPTPWRTVRDAIGDLAPPKGTEIRKVPPPYNLHFKRNPTKKSLTRYKVVSKEGMNRFDLQRLAPELTPECWIRKKTGGTDLFGRLWWDRPAFTIRTEFFKPEKGRYLHPSQQRPITHREAARLQTFPDDFDFVGSKIEIARQIGNAVPPLLASMLAERIFALLAVKVAVESA